MMNDSLENVKKKVVIPHRTAGAPGIMTYVRLSSTGKNPKYTLSEAAQMVGKSPETLVRWEKQFNIQINSEWQFFQKDETTKGVRARIFTPQDITRLRSFAAGIKTGRPRKSA